MEAWQDWTSPRFEDELGHLDRGGVTFEFLRRNKRYWSDYKQVLDSAAPDKTKQAEAAQCLCQCWGVTFPGRSISAGPGSTASLASADVSGNHHR